MSRTTYRLVERVIIALILLGIIGMFQPLSIALYKYGFLTLLLGTISFIIVSHISPKREPAADVGSVSAAQTGEHRAGADR